MGDIAAPLGGADLSQEASHPEGLCSHLLLMKEYVCVELGAWPSKASKQARLVRLEAGGCAVRASPGRLGSLAEPQCRGTSP